MNPFRQPVDGTCEDRASLPFQPTFINMIPVSFASKLVLASFAVLTIVIARYAAASRRPQAFPPGPSILPVIGNLHQFPLKKPFIKWVIPATANMTLGLTIQIS